MKDELQIEIDTGWHVFNDLTLEIISKNSRSKITAAKVRQISYPNVTIHKEPD